MRTPPAKNVDAYLKRYSPEISAALQRVRQAIRKAAPKAEEVISYHIPIYKQNGPVVCFAGYENHCSFYVINKKIITDFADELKEFKTSGTTIHFSPEKPLPVSLIQKIVKRRIKENEEIISLKKLAKGKK